MVKIRESGKYTKMWEEFCVEDTELELLIQEKVKLFKKNPNDTRLDNHGLTGRMEGKWAFRITEDIRIVYEWLGKTTARFLAIGHHKQVYLRN